VAKTSTMTIYVDGIEVLCEYTVDGWHIPATDIDPEENPEVTLLHATVGGVDVTRWDALLGFTERLSGDFFDRDDEIFNEFKYEEYA
jgi:hypothetical protein